MIWVRLIGSKSKSEKWDMMPDGTPETLDLISTLNRIEKIRHKYNIPGTFYKEYRLAPHDDKQHLLNDEISWG